MCSDCCCSRYKNTKLIMYWTHQVKFFLGLVASWKQPVYYNYDTQMTKQILTNIIGNLYEIGYNVVAIVSDMGPSNVGLWRDLCISMDRTHFEHPVTKQNIYAFADVPHLLKLARNHFLDK